jgi:hypothetical protein
MRRILIALGLASAAVLAVATVSHGGGEQLGQGALVWDQKPQVYRNPELPNDRVLRGVVRNDSLRVMSLTARDLNVRGASGKELESAVVFAPTFIRGVFPENRGQDIPESEQLRIGLRARIEPGKTVPVTVSWREPEARASVIDYGSGSLPVPGPRRSGARRG